MNSSFFQYKEVKSANTGFTNLANTGVPHGVGEGFMTPNISSV